MADSRSEKLLIVFAVFLFLFNFPLLSMVDRTMLWLGVPTLYFYFFLVWGIMILTISMIVRKHKK